MLQGPVRKFNPRTDGFSDVRHFDPATSAFGFSLVIVDKHITKTRCPLVWLLLEGYQLETVNTNQDGKPRVDVGEGNFDAEVLKEDRPVLVAFWSPWSKPCQILNSVLDEVATACSGEWKLVRINADNHPALSLSYDIQSVPTLLYFVGGTLRAISVGTVSKEAIHSQMQIVSRGGDSTPPSTHNLPARPSNP